MALPFTLLSDRMHKVDFGNIATLVGVTEQGLCDLLGITIDTDYSSPLITTALARVRLTEEYTGVGLSGYLPWDTVDWDNANFFSLDNDEYFTIPADDYYKVAFHAHINNAGAWTLADIYLNGHSPNSIPCNAMFYTDSSENSSYTVTAISHFYAYQSDVISVYMSAATMGATVDSASLSIRRVKL